MEAQNLRLHGEGPYRLAVLHGEPGAPGDMELVARELAHTRGVLEPFQTKDSIQGQLNELRDVLVQYGSPPVHVIGWS